MRRQISVLYYERLGLSKNKENIAKMIETGTYAHEIQDVLREPYMFEVRRVNGNVIAAERHVFGRYT